MSLLNGLVIPDASLLTTKQREIDESIDDNTFEIQECLENIQCLLKGLPLSDAANSSMDLEEHLNCISNYHCIEKTACYDLDIEDLQNFFVKLNDFLNKNTGKEGAVLAMLLKLCSHTGFTLPWKSTSHDGQRASMLSLNVVNDEDEQMCEALWEELRRGLEEHVVACLYQLPVAEESRIVRHSRSEYIERLHLLVSTRQLCQQYRSLRVWSLNQLINDQLSSEGESATFSQIVNAFERISGSVMTMIDSDFKLLVSGLFRKIASTFEIIRSIYFDKLMDEIDSVLDDLANEIYGQMYAKAASRRQSDYALAGKLKEKITKSKSKTNMERVNSTGATSTETDQIHLESHIVDGIVRLGKALGAVDQHVYNLYLMSYTEQRGTSSHTLASAESIRGVLKSTSVTDISILSDSLTSDASDLQSILNSGRLHYQSYDKAPQVVDKPMHHDKPQLLWQSSLKRFVSDLSLFVEAHINSAADSCVTALHVVSRPVTTKLCPCYRGSKMEYPVTVWKAVSDFVLALEFVFPLAQAGHALLPIRQTFISATMSSSKALLETIQKVVENLGEVGESNKAMLVAVSSIAVLRNTLYQCDTTLHRDNERQNPFVLVYHQTCQTVDSLAQQYVSLQVDFIHNSLFHDADSFNWSHHQEFFESERCSFPVQAWSLHMQKIRLELWDICPPTNAVAIFSDLLRQTLENITQRYLNEFPTYRRMEQFRLDIGVILYTVYELLFHICPSSPQLLDLECVAHAQPHLTIHSCCCKLLAMLAITTSPLNDLYKVFKKGHQKKNKRRRQNADSNDEETGYYSYWLSWLQPDIIPKGITRLSDMQTTTALYLQIKLMLAQPEIQWSSLIQVLTMKDFTLPIMILTQSNLSVSPNSKSSPAAAAPAATASSSQLKSSAGISRCELAFCDGTCHLHNIEHLFEPFLMVLLYCNKPTSLYDVLLPVIDRGNQWSLLVSDKFYQNMKTTMPPWMQVVTDVIADNLESMLNSIIQQVSLHLSHPSHLDICNFLQNLPCGCPLDPELSLEDEVNWSNMLIKEVLSKLPEEVSRLPISVCVMMERVGDQLQEQLPNSSALSDRFILQIIGYTISSSLTNQKYLERINGGKLPSNVLAKLEQSAECVYAAMSKGADVVNLRLSKEQMKCLTENHHWIAEQRESIVRNVKRRESLWPDLDVDGGTAESFTEFATTNIVSELLETEKGECYLRQLYNLIANNQNWIFFSLDIHETLAQALPVEQLTFVPDVLNHCDVRSQAKSNPLVLYNSIGDNKIDFEIIRHHTANLSSLLQNDLGLSDLSVSSLLQHRHDFQDESHLDANEKRHVKQLRAKFNIVSAHDDTS